MKKTVIVGALALLGGPVVMVHADSTGTISFQGNITDATCEVSINGDGATATVILPAVSTSALSAAGSSTGRTEFVMELTNCLVGTSDGISKVSAYFQPGPGVDANGNLKQMTSAGATNIALQLLDGDNDTPIKAGDASQSTNNQYYSIPASTEELDIPYFVQYYSEAGGATAGAVTGTVVYNLQYQ